MQGFNMGRYVPPDLEGTTSANALAGKHALGARARKLKTEGILTVRFEMPYAIWCTTCPKPTIIGQGVRFNAEKKKIGNYYSTPIYSFRMKHAVCGGGIEIRTDPKNTAYVVFEGAKARDYGEDVVREGEEGMEILSPEERERRREDAFAKLEGRKEEQGREKEQAMRIKELYEHRDRDWDDPYEASRRVRKSFRVERKVREKAADVDEKLKERMGLDVDLLPEHEDDKRRAAFIDFGPLDNIDDGAMKAASKPLFLLENATPTETAPRKKEVTTRKTASTKKEKEAQRRRQALQQEIRQNSRISKDPFLTFGSSANATDTTFRAIPGIKRTRSEVDSTPEKVPEPLTTPATVTKQLPGAGLVTYGSDDSD